LPDGARVCWQRSYGATLILSFDAVEEAPGDPGLPLAAQPPRKWRPFFDAVPEEAGGDSPAALFADCFKPKIELRDGIDSLPRVPEFDVVPQDVAVKKYQELIDDQDWDALAVNVTGKPASDLQDADWLRVKQRVSRGTYHVVFKSRLAGIKVYSLKTCLVINPAAGWNKSCLEGSRFLDNPPNHRSLTAAPNPVKVTPIGQQAYVRWSDDMGSLYLSDQIITPRDVQQWSGYGTRASQLVVSYRNGLLDQTRLEAELKRLHSDLHAEHLRVLMPPDF
jgi:hypothetical protein